MFMNVIYFVIGDLASITIIAFGLANVSCSLFTSIPCTIKLKKSGVAAKYNKIFFSIIMTLIIWIALISFVILFVFHFEKYYLNCGLIFGIITSLLGLIGKCGCNSKNVNNYIDTYSKYFDSDIELTPKIRYCKYCGKPIDESKKCTGCGKQYFRIPKLKKQTFFIVALLIFVCLLGYECFYLSNRNIALKAELDTTISENTENTKKQKNENEKLQKKYNELREQYDSVRGTNEALRQQLFDCKATAEYWDEYGALATENGNKYHKYNCQYIRESIGTIYVMTIWEAKDLGYTPCSKCHN